MYLNKEETETHITGTLVTFSALHVRIIMENTFHKVPHSAAPRKSAQDGIENIHIVNICTEKSAQLQSSLQHTEN
jgi:hypothetical protein